MNLRTTILTLLLVAQSAAIVFADPGGYDERPVPVKTPPPVYPAEKKAAGVAGLVTLRVRIDEKGDVLECSVQKSSDPGFEDAATLAVSKWKFKPAVKAGAPVACTLVVPVKFD